MPNPITAYFKLENGKDAAFVTQEADVPELPLGPMLAISVVDFDQAVELLAAVNRTLTRPPAKRKKKASRAAPGADSAPPAETGAGEQPGGTDSHDSRSSPGEQVAGKDAGAEEGGAATPRSTPASAGSARGPAGAPEQKQDREAGAGRLAGSGSGNGGPPTVPAAAKKCIAPDCAMEAVVADFDDLCDLHKGVGASIHAEWLKLQQKVTAPRVGRRRAHEIAEKLEGAPDAGDGKTHAA